MKLNNKGISIIETILSFVLIMVMVTGMLVIVMNYRNKAALSIEKLELDTFKNTLTQDIQKDILTLGLKEINHEGSCSSLTSIDNCINIVFQDNTSKALGISKVSVNDRNSIENKYIYYDGIKYELTEVLPATIPENRTLIDFQSIIIDNKPILKTDKSVLEDGTVVYLYAIDINISHIDFKQDFGIHIVASTDDINL